MTGPDQIIRPELEFGLDTFGDVPEDDDGELVSARGGDPAGRRRGGARRRARRGRHRPRRAPPPGVRDLHPGDGAGRHRHPHQRIRLASGVTVLSSDDPSASSSGSRPWTRSRTAGREVILGRGSFTESFPLFGYDLRDYDVLFEEKIELFARLLDEKPVTWSGTTRAALEDADVFPKTESGRLDDLGRCRRLAPVGRPHGALRAAADARHHRRPAGALRAVRRSLPPRRRISSARWPTRSGCTPRASSPTPTRRRGSCSGRATR